MYVIDKNSIVNEWADTEINRQRLASGKYGVVEYTGEVEQAYNGNYYLKGHAPVKPEPTKEEIRSIREQLFSSSPCSDYKYDYEEAVARYGADSEQAISTSKIWLAEKDKIRKNNPYPDEVKND